MANLKVSLHAEIMSLTIEVSELVVDIKDKIKTSSASVSVTNLPPQPGMPIEKVNVDDVYIQQRIINPWLSREIFNCAGTDEIKLTRIKYLRASLKPLMSKINSEISEKTNRHAFATIQTMLFSRHVSEHLKKIAETLNNWQDNYREIIEKTALESKVGVKKEKDNNEEDKTKPHKI